MRVGSEQHIEASRAEVEDFVPAISETPADGNVRYILNTKIERNKILAGVSGHWSIAFSLRLPPYRLTRNLMIIRPLDKCNFVLLPFVMSGPNQRLLLRLLYYP